ncbi:MAG: 30S ribosomal protein S5 [Fimbriimonadaceae bacterium]|nr:30S ribosomal protein S5 [Fimbriimonadaceae bacterium]
MRGDDRQRGPGGGDRDRGRGGPGGRGDRRGRRDEGPALDERVVDIARVDKVHKGGRNLSWRALVVVGDNQGRVGAAIGKAREIPDAIRKGSERARKEMVQVKMVGGTIPHAVQSRVQTANVLLKPAVPGTGVIAGGAVRAVMEAAGVSDVLTKSLGSNNPVNIVWAAMECLRQLRTVEEVAELRGKKPAEVGFIARGGETR